MHARSNAPLLGSAVRLAVALAAILLLAPAARADVIVTVNGGKISGTIVKETSREVHIRNRGGIVVTIRRDEIDRIERQDTSVVFAQRRAALGKDDVKGLLELARWAYDQGLGDESRACLEAVLAVDPAEPTARRVLGYQKVGDKWLRGDALHEALGHVKYKGRWVTPQELGYLEAGFTKGKDGEWIAPEREATPSEGVGPKAIELPAELVELLRVVRGNSSVEKRLEAMRAVVDRGADGRAALVAELEAMLAKAKKKLSDHFKRGAGKVRGKLAARIVERRREAWAIIFDKGKYPDENHGAVGQPLVDAAVEKLNRCYDDPLGELAADDAEVQDLLARVTEASGWLREFGGKGPKDAALRAALAAEVAELIDMRRFPVSAADAKVLEKSQRILEYNRAVPTSLSEEERACVDATNEYRMLFGLPALKAFEPLVQAARKHSAEMNRLRYFDHTSPTPANRSPDMRCAREGARFSGENIAMGMNTGRAAFHAWYTSSGHHRNILGKGHRSIGIGQDGKYWTQNFGSDDPAP